MRKILSLFSGAGFLDFGFAESGFEVIWGIEIVKEFAYANNYNIKKRYNTEGVIVNEDITGINVNDLPKARGVIGGPPCQDFSIGNASSTGVEGKRGMLVWDYLSKIDKIRPDFFLFENVSSLYQIKKHRKEAFEPLIEQFEGLGYTVYHKVLNSLEYGIPQDRKRVFVVGFKNAIADKLKQEGHPGFLWPEPKYKNPIRGFNWPKQWEIGIDIGEQEYLRSLECPYELTVHSAISDTNVIERLPNHLYFNPKSAKFSQIAEGDVKRKSFKRLHRFRYSPTVAYGNNEVHLHPTLPRRLSVREALRIQSVPDWYEFPPELKKDKMFKMVGNGVPFKLAQLLANQVREVIDCYDSLK